MLGTTPCYVNEWTVRHLAPRRLSRRARSAPGIVTARRCPVCRGWRAPGDLSALVLQAVWLAVSRRHSRYDLADSNVYGQGLSG